MRVFSTISLVILFFVSSLFGRVDFENIKTLLHITMHAAESHSHGGEAHSHSHDDDAEKNHEEHDRHSDPTQIQVEHSHHHQKGSEDHSEGTHSHQINLSSGALFLVAFEIQSVGPKRVTIAPLPLEPQILQQQGFSSRLFRPPIA